MPREVVDLLEGVSNFRDIGGLETTSGKMLRTGLLYRSAELSGLTRKDLDRLHEWGIQLICDLRSPQESRRKQPRLKPGREIRQVNIPIQEQLAHKGSRTKLFGFLFGKTGGARFQEFSREYYRHLAFQQTDRIREAIGLLSLETNLPALIHCSAGKDRTGFLAAIIQLLAGVPYELVREDYLRTNDYFERAMEKFIRRLRRMTLFQISTERLKLILMAHPEVLDEAYHAILQAHGSIENYLRDRCEIDEASLRRLKFRLLD